MASSPRRSSSSSAKQPQKGGILPWQDPPRKLLRLSRDLEAAIQRAMKYVAHATGAEPSQEELAAVLKSYFTLGEITNQINYLRKKPLENAGPEALCGSLRPTLRINLFAVSGRNCLARAGFFVQPIADAIEGIRKHARTVHGVAPSDACIALSLRSSFILSELKNQIVHARDSCATRAQGDKRPPPSLPAVL